MSSNPIPTLSTQDNGPRWWPRLLPLVILVVGLALVVVLMRGGDDTERQRPERPPRLVEVTPVAPTTEHVSLEAWGTVRAAREVILRPRVAGEITAMGEQAEPGGLPARGDALVTLDDSDYRLALRRAESALTRARASRDQERGRHAVAQAEFMLAEVTDITPEERRLMLREPQLEAADAEVDAAEADLDEARLNLARTRLAAPFNALILDRHADIGSRVGSGQDLLSLVDRDTFWVELSLPATSLRWLPQEADSPVTLYHDGVWGPEQSRQGRVLRVRGDVDEPGRMARVLVAVDDPLGLDQSDRPRLLLGSHVRGQLRGRELEGVYALRPEWLRDDDTVWVMDDDERLAIRQPELLQRGRHQVLVRGELAAGERVVTSAIGVARAGMPLRTAEDGGEHR